MTEDLVTIKNYYYDHETLLIEPLLQSEGIEYFLKDHKIVSIDPFVSYAIGGIKLRVKRKDAEKALEIINEFEKNQDERQKEAEIIIEGKKFEKRYLECPTCNSENIYVEKLSALRSIIYSMAKRNHYCLDCRYRWKEY